MTDRASEPDDILQISDLTVRYSSRPGTPSAVDGVDLAVRRGEILGVAGESGSGKSTLAVALLRLLKRPGRVTAGSILFRPRDRSEVDLLRVGGQGAARATLAQSGLSAARVDELTQPGGQDP
ncbi:ATP-binding cassette domain-containing protein [Microlunatus sp. Gsoil 973]|uniref:ATP-binding cassette domain-containing protein n=1 Tax=Microlunatus sp. Gsoil 973 TaxID=2672569 RepID=UPI001E64935B|nr:ATP-binding cassette domain-containing protein [Microlunatus sp. Gsoil 973]